MNAQPLTFSVAAWAPLARPQALATGWLKPRVPTTLVADRAQSQHSPTRSGPRLHRTV
jgi:hypothetical protein